MKYFKICQLLHPVELAKLNASSEGWSKTRVSIAEILKPNGIVLNFGWDTIGMGKKRGMEIIEIMLVSHGIGHNGTICMAEQKRSLF